MYTAVIPCQTIDFVIPVIFDRHHTVIGGRQLSSEPTPELVAEVLDFIPPITSISEVGPVFTLVVISDVKETKKLAQAAKSLTRLNTLTVFRNGLGPSGPVFGYTLSVSMYNIPSSSAELDLLNLSCPNSLVTPEDYITQYNSVHSIYPHFRHNLTGQATLTGLTIQPSNLTGIVPPSYILPRDVISGATQAWDLLSRHFTEVLGVGIVPIVQPPAMTIVEDDDTLAKDVIHPDPIGPLPRPGKQLSWAVDNHLMLSQRQWAKYRARETGRLGTRLLGVNRPIQYGMKRDAEMDYSCLVHRDVAVGVERIVATLSALLAAEVDHPWMEGKRIVYTAATRISPSNIRALTSDALAHKADHVVIFTWKKGCSTPTVNPAGPHCTVLSVPLIRGYARSLANYRLLPAFMRFRHRHLVVIMNAKPGTIGMTLQDAHLLLDAETLTTSWVSINKYTWNPVINAYHQMPSGFFSFDDTAFPTLLDRFCGDYGPDEAYFLRFNPTSLLANLPSLQYEAENTHNEYSSFIGLLPKPERSGFAGLAYVRAGSRLVRLQAFVSATRPDHLIRPRHHPNYLELAMAAFQSGFYHQPRLSFSAKVSSWLSVSAAQNPGQLLKNFCPIFVFGSKGDVVPLQYMATVLAKAKIISPILSADDNGYEALALAETRQSIKAAVYSIGASRVCQAWPGLSLQPALFAAASAMSYSLTPSRKEITPCDPATGIWALDKIAGWVWWLRDLDVHIGTYSHARAFPRSANGTSPLRYLRNTGEIAGLVARGSSKERLPPHLEALAFASVTPGDHQAQFARASVVIAYGAGTIQTARMSGARVICPSTVLDRNYRDKENAGPKRPIETPGWYEAAFVDSVRQKLGARLTPFELVRYLYWHTSFIQVLKYVWVVIAFVSFIITETRFVFTNDFLVSIILSVFGISPSFFVIVFLSLGVSLALYASDFLTAEDLILMRRVALYATWTVISRPAFWGAWGSVKNLGYAILITLVLELTNSKLAPAAIAALLEIIWQPMPAGEAEVFLEFRPIKGFGWLGVHSSLVVPSLGLSIEGQGDSGVDTIGSHFVTEVIQRSFSPTGIAIPLSISKESLGAVRQLEGVYGPLWNCHVALLVLLNRSTSAYTIIAAVILAPALGLTIPFLFVGLCVAILVGLFTLGAHPSFASIWFSLYSMPLIHKLIISIGGEATHDDAEDAEDRTLPGVGEMITVDASVATRRKAWPALADLAAHPVQPTFTRHGLNFATTELSIQGVEEFQAFEQSLRARPDARMTHPDTFAFLRKTRLAGEWSMETDAFGATFQLALKSGVISLKVSSVVDISIHHVDRIHQESKAILRCAYRLAIAGPRNAKLETSRLMKAVTPRLDIVSCCSFSEAWMDNSGAMIVCYESDELVGCIYDIEDLTETTMGVMRKEHDWLPPPYKLDFPHTHVMPTYMSWPSHWHTHVPDKFIPEASPFPLRDNYRHPVYLTNLGLSTRTKQCFTLRNPSAPICACRSDSGAKYSTIEDGKCVLCGREHELWSNDRHKAIVAEYRECGFIATSVAPHYRRGSSIVVELPRYAALIDGTLALRKRLFNKLTLPPGGKTSAILVPVISAIKMDLPEFATRPERGYAFKILGLNTSELAGQILITSSEGKSTAVEVRGVITDVSKLKALVRCLSAISRGKDDGVVGHEFISSFC